jgi:hypothetical protein
MMVRYYKRVDDDGTVSTLARIRNAEDGLHGEYYARGQWHEWSGALRIFSDPLEGEPIGADEAEHIRQAFDDEDSTASS